MDEVYNNVARKCAIELDGRRANNLRQGVMETIAKQLKGLRERSGLSVRDVARYLEFDVHSRYSYYESARFTGQALPLPLARRLAGLFAAYGVPADETLRLAGLQGEEIEAEAENAKYTQERPVRLFMEVNLPNEASLTRMFDAMLELAGHEDASGELARTLALLLPSVLAGTTGEFAGESLDPDFRPRREALLQRHAKERKPPKP